MPPLTRMFPLALAAALLLTSASASAAPTVPVPEGDTLVDLIADNGAETSLAGFAPFSSSDGSVARLTSGQIAGAASVRATVKAYGRVSTGHDYPYAEGPLADAVVGAAQVRVDSSSPAKKRLQLCTIAYLQDDSEPHSQCSTYPVDAKKVVPVQLSLDTQGKQVARAYFQAKLDDSGKIVATFDDVHLYVVQRPAAQEPQDPEDPQDPGDGGGPSVPDGGDLEQVGFALHPSKYRSLTSEMNLADDLTAAGPAANAAPKDIAVTLYPAATTVGTTRRVSFGVPLAPGTLLDTRKVRVTAADGHELAAYVRSLGAWTHMPAQSLLCNGLQATGNPGIRSVLVQFDLPIASAAPQSVTVSINRSRTQSLTSAVPVRDTYRTVDDGTYASAVNHSGHVIREPAVLAAVDHRHLACSGLTPMSDVAGAHPYLAKSDQATQDFFPSVINQAERKQSWPVTNAEDRVDFYSDPEPWLYDRAQTFYNGYVRTGDVEMLREANRAVDHYQQEIEGPESCPGTFYPYCVGSFRLKNTDPTAPYPDLKYSYSENLLSDYLLNGDPDVLRKIGYVSYGQEFHVDLTGGIENTERHRAFALLAHAVDYELTGSPHQLQVIQAGIAAMRARQTATLGGHAPNGCFNYPPEGQTDTFSPWMSALLAQALLRSYAATGNQQVGPSLVDLARCELDRGTDELRPGQNGPMAVGDLYPYYIGASYGTKHDADGDDPFNGFEHAIDVAVPVALGAFFTAGPTERTRFATAAKRLLHTHDESIDYWTRDGADTQAAGRTKYRVGPARKFAWQYKNAGLLGWALDGPGQ